MHCKLQIANQGTMNKQISHKGNIEAISGNEIMVRILQTSACAGCKIASHCASSESKEKIVEVHDEDATRFTIGETVNVIASGSAGEKAVFFGFVIPFFVLIAAIFGAYLAKASEPMCGIIGLASLLPYYALLYLCRSYFKKIIRFQIEKY